MAHFGTEICLTIQPSPASRKNRAYRPILVRTPKHRGKSNSTYLLRTDTWYSLRWTWTDGSISFNEVRHAHPQPQTLTQGTDHGQMEEAGEKGPHPRLREERHGVDTEPRKSRLQQNLPEDYVQLLGSVQVRRMVGPVSAGLFFLRILLSLKYPTKSYF